MWVLPRWVLPRADLWAACAAGSPVLAAIPAGILSPRSMSYASPSTSHFKHFLHDLKFYFTQGFLTEVIRIKQAVCINCLHLCITKGTFSTCPSTSAIVCIATFTCFVKSLHQQYNLLAVLPYLDP